MKLTIRVRCEDGVLQPIGVYEKATLKDFLSKVDEGTTFRMEVFPWKKRRDARMRRFFMYRDKYAETNNYDKEHAKEELKRGYGVTEPWEPASPMLSTRTGRFIEMHGEIHFHVSLNDYTGEEMETLNRGARQACIDIGADIEDIEREFV